MLASPLFKPIFEGENELGTFFFSPPVLSICFTKDLKPGSYVRGDVNSDKKRAALMNLSLAATLRFSRNPPPSPLSRVTYFMNKRKFVYFIFMLQKFERQNECIVPFQQHKLLPILAIFRHTLCSRSWQLIPLNDRLKEQQL